MHAGMSLVRIGISQLNQSRSIISVNSLTLFQGNGGFGPATTKYEIKTNICLNMWSFSYYCH